MIKIIKEGQLPKKTKTMYTIWCSTCGCKFECDGSDLMVEKRPGGKRQINCPCCGKTIVLFDGLAGRSEDANYESWEVDE